jgi:hypothetical protein
MAPTTPRSGAVVTTKFTFTAEPPARRVVAEPAPVAPPAAPATAPAPKKAAPASPIKAAAAALLLALLLAFGLQPSAFAAATTFYFTNDLPVALTTMFYTNTASGYVYLQATNTAAGAIATNSTLFAVQGVAVQATNSSLARLVPFASIPNLGCNISYLYSNTWVFASGVPPYTGVSPGTNVAAGQTFTTVPPGTNAVPSTGFNTNLP